MSERAELLRWYDRERRDLPWRASRDPWPVLVSELMLQQTRVEVVRRYFSRFLERFPNPETLASAPESELLALWSGLGYYRRARSLRAAAIEIVRRGSWPETSAELERLPGVGSYTAAAVASIAFGQPVAVVDGNVIRVVARRLALGEPPARAGVRRRIAAAAAELVDPDRPGDSNQALMELGATLCTPRAPRCGQCPLATGCRGRAEGCPERYPPPRPRTKPVALAIAAAAVERREALLLVRRGDDEELLPGLWELPAVEGDRPDESSFARRYGGVWTFGEARSTVRHAITFRALTVTAWRADWSPDELAESGSTGFFSREEALALPLTGVARKLVARLGAPARER